MRQVNDNYKIIRDYVIGNKDWSNSKLIKINLKGAILKEINLNNSHLIAVNLDSCNLEKATLQSAQLHNCNLKKSRLKEATFSEANLSQINFQDAHLEKTNFSKASLQNVDFTGAYLYRADFRGAFLQGAKLDNTFLVGAIYDRETVFDKDFSIEDTEMICVDSLQKPQLDSLEQQSSLDNDESQEQKFLLYRGIKYDSLLHFNHVETSESISKNGLMKYLGQIISH